MVVFKSMKSKVVAVTIGLMLITGSVFAGAKFSDVKPSHWFYTYVMKASEMGIVNGYADGTFKPNQDVTRAQLAKIMVDYDKKVSSTIFKMSTDEQKVINAVAKAIPYTVEVRSDDSSGSGFFIKNSYIMTNAHVVGVNKQVKVITVNGEEITGDVIALDTLKDMAIIKINRTYNYLTFSNSLTVGQTALAIGHPFGYPNSVSRGIVSRINVNDVKESNMFQMDASVNFGNSGGAVINSNGEVIGMTTAKYLGDNTEGLGLAITAEELIKFINENIK